MKFHLKVKLFFFAILFIFSLFLIKSYLTYLGEQESIRWHKKYEKELAKKELAKKERETIALLNIVDEILQINIARPKFDFKKADIYCVFGNTVLLLLRENVRITHFEDDDFQYVTSQSVEFGYDSLFNLSDLTYPDLTNDTSICSYFPSIKLKIHDNYYFTNSIKILNESHQYVEVQLLDLKGISYSSDSPGYMREIEQNKLGKNPIENFNKDLLYLNLIKKTVKLTNGYVNKLGDISYKDCYDNAFTYYWGGDFRRAPAWATYFVAETGKSYDDYSEFNKFYNSTYYVTLCKKDSISDLGEKREITKTIAKIPIIDLKGYKRFDYVCFSYQGIESLAKDLGLRITSTTLPMILNLTKSKPTVNSSVQEDIIKKLYQPYNPVSTKLILDKMELLGEKYNIDSTFYISHMLLSKLDPVKKQQLILKVADAYSYEKRNGTTLLFVDDSTDSTVANFNLRTSKRTKNFD